MCGIIGYVGEMDASEVVYDGLKRLEYRGYDSAGVATLSSNPGLTVRKGEGTIGELEGDIDFGSMEGRIGLGHTRWATHGGVSKANAHPHTDCSGRLAIVHNGIVENHDELRSRLEGHEFSSETDTEVIVHYIEERLSAGSSVKEAMRSFMDEAKGTFAVVLVDSSEEKLYAMTRKSPLAVGIGEDEHFLGSDIYAFSPYTDRAIFMGDDEFAVVTADDVALFDRDGAEIQREPERFEWDAEGDGKEGYEHYMLKEIHEQPAAAERLVSSLRSSQSEEFEDLVSRVEDSGKVIFTAAGSSYHASLLGVYFLQRAGIEAQALIASEFQNYERVDEDTLVVAVSQSGETMDVIEAIEYSRKRGGSVASIVNVPHSTIQRKSDVSLEIEAGQEVCVAATKTFTNQAVSMLALAEEAGADVDIGEVSEGLAQVINSNEERAVELARELVDTDDIYVLGRGPTYPIAREIALKLKEIPYIHAEGMMGGELKHGTLALIEAGTPVVSLIPSEDDEILSNVEEVEAREAKSIRVSPFYGRFDLPEDGAVFALYATTLGFLLSYYIAKLKGLPVDRPRNLAKSVTVK